MLTLARYSGSGILILSAGGYAVPQSQASCKIVIRGSFDVSWADYMGGMLVDVQVEQGKIRTTTLFGQPIDLAAFLGMLHMLIDLGFPVLAFEYQQANLINEVEGSGIKVN
jgi:hypothetical protein